jgi:outer membrane protein assembly factor BamA
MLPIICYDSDIGFGFGGKLFLFDVLNSNESFDLILFNSTKGERWYKFVYSIPDFQTRHGKKFPFSVDFVAEYDKFNKYYFYTSFNDKKETAYEKINLGVFLTKGFLKDFYSSLALQFKSFNLYNKQKDSLPYYPYRSIPETAQFFSILLSSTWDTRNSYINPESGSLAQFEAEFISLNNHNDSEDYINFRFLLAFQNYRAVIFEKLIMAFRIKLENILIPYESYSPMVFMKLPAGGSNTLRGYPLDQFRFTEMILVNYELRFPIWWKIGGVTGFDYATGNINELESESLVNAVLGLRLFMDNFIVRADFGFSGKSTGFYLNFGHLF